MKNSLKTLTIVAALAAGTAFGQAKPPLLPTGAGSVAGPLTLTCSVCAPALSIPNVVGPAVAIQTSGSLNLTGAGPQLTSTFAGTFTIQGASGQTLALNAQGAGTLALQIAGASIATVSGSVLSATHVAGVSTGPTGVAAGGGCGTASAANLSGNDVSGTIGVTCGTAGSGATNIVSATFKTAYVGTPICTFVCANAATCALAAASVAFNSSTNSTLAVKSNATAPTGTLLWDYSCTAPTGG